MEIHARSTLHAIDGRASDVTGTIELDGALQLLGGHVEVPVSTLRSGNPVEDAELQRRIEARRYPTIAGQATHITKLDGDGRFRVNGDLTFHGVTRPVTGDLEVTQDGDSVRITGEQVFDVRDFGIKPPRILMLRVEPDVRVRIELVAKPL